METLNSLARRSATARRRLSACRHATRIHLTTTHPTEFVDLTDRLDTLIAGAGLCFGILNVQALHTTTAIVVNEHEPLLLADFQSLLEAAAPGDGRYQHDDTRARTVNLTEAERPNGHAHCCPRRRASTSWGAACCSGAGSVCSSWSWTARASATSRC
jgi:thiamine phosphate synthase YjbQ (UPF0047 family)